MKRTNTYKDQKEQWLDIDEPSAVDGQRDNAGDELESQEAIDSLPEQDADEAFCSDEGPVPLVLDICGDEAGGKEGEAVSVDKHGEDALHRDAVFEFVLADPDKCDGFNCTDSQQGHLIRRELSRGIYEYQESRCKSWGCEYCSRNILLPQLREDLLSLANMQLPAYWIKLEASIREGIDAGDNSLLADSYLSVIEQCRQIWDNDIEHFCAQVSRDNCQPHISSLLWSDTRLKDVFCMFWRSSSHSWKIEFREVDSNNVEEYIHRLTREIYEAMLLTDGTGTFYGFSEGLERSRDRKCADGVWEQVEDPSILHGKDKIVTLADIGGHPIEFAINHRAEG